MTHNVGQLPTMRSIVGDHAVVVANSVVDGIWHVCVGQVWQMQDADGICGILCGGQKEA